MSNQSRRQAVLACLRMVRLGTGLLALSWLLGMNAPSARAQTYLQNIGIPTFTTQLPVENGFINAANGNLHLEIPLASYPQRGGHQFKVSLMYDSAIWQQVAGYSSGWQPTNVPTAGGSRSLGGWRLVTSADTGTVSSGETYSGYCAAEDDYLWVTYSPFIWTAPDGTQHSFPISTVAPNYPGVCGNSGTPTGNAHASDGSGYAMYVWNYTNAIVYAPDGTIVYNDGSSWTPIDTNGNYYTLQAPAASMGGYQITTGNPSDTLGKTPVTTGVSGNQIYFDVWTPSGNLSRYTATTESINVYTNFAVPGWSEYSIPITVIQSLQLPDGTNYSFAYDSGTTPGYYGLLRSMTLPTGGTANYNFTNFADGYGHVYRWINGRSTPDGSWTYVPQLVTTCPAPGYVDCQQQVTVTKPLVPPNISNPDQTVYTFTLNGGDWPTEVQYYTGTALSGTLLATATQCFSFVTVSYGSCSYSVTTTSASPFVHLLSRTTTLPIPSGNLGTTTQYTWDSSNNGYFGQVVQLSEWNFGTPLTNAADRITYISYLGGTGYINANIVNRPTSVTVSDSSGVTMVAQTNYYYDYMGAPTSVTGTYNHDDTNYGTGNTVRGNLEATQRLDTTSTYVDTWRTHDTTGQLTASFDSNSNKTTYAYSSSYSNALPTSITNPLNQSINLAYDWGTGLLTSAQDLNVQSTGFTYDNMFRPLTTSYPDGGHTTVQYNYSGGLYTGATTTDKINSSQNMVTTLNVDLLGRVTSSVLVTDPDGQTTVATQYDTNGRVLKVSNPYRSTSNPTDGSETPSYDGLDRVIQMTDPDNSTAHTYYGAAVSAGGGQTSQVCSLGYAGYPILYVDEVGNKLENWIDGFGRVIETDEPSSTSGTLSAYTCYTYDLNNNPTEVIAVGGTQTRNYSYDMISRLKSKTEPESGTTTFDYGTFGSSSDPLCSGDNSAPCTRTDARGITITYTYDALNRLKTKSTSNSSWGDTYTYDVSSIWGVSVQNSIGRLVMAQANEGAPLWRNIATISSYDTMGRPAFQLHVNQLSSTPNQQLNYYYNLLGEISSYTNGQGVTFTQSFDTAGRLTGLTSSLVDSQHPAALATVAPSVGYLPDGAIQAMTLGNGLTETNMYNNRLQPCRLNVNSSGTYLAQCTDNPVPGNIQDFTYGFGAANNGNVSSLTGSGTQVFNRTYTDDYVNRALTLSSPSDPSGCTGLSWNIDALANRTDQNLTSGTCTFFHATVNSSNNRFSVSPYQYDASGNLTNDGVHTYTYDGENRITQVDGGSTASYVYDAYGRRALKTAGGSTTTYMYDLGGHVATELIGSVWTKGYIYRDPAAGNQLLAQYSNSTTYFAHQDHLGSTRLLTAMDHSIAECDDYLPFGEQLSYSGCSNTGISTHKFTGYERDPETGLDYAFARYYSPRLGRFTSGDLGPGDITDPQTLNRYAYVRNNSVNMTDPTGLCGDFVGDDGDCGGFGFGIGFGFGWGWGGSDSRTGPQSPVYFPPNIGTSPNGTLTSDDPFSGETNGIPNGLRIPMLGLAGILGVPNSPGLIFDVTAGGMTWGSYAEYLDWLQNLLLSSGVRLLGEIGHCKGGDAVCIPGQAPIARGNLGHGALDDAVNMSIAAPFDAPMMENGALFGTRYAGNAPLLNSNDYFRVGWHFMRSEGSYAWRMVVGGTRIFLNPKWW